MTTLMSVEDRPKKMLINMSILEIIDLLNNIGY